MEAMRVAKVCWRGRGGNQKFHSSNSSTRDQWLTRLACILIQLGFAESECQIFRVKRRIECFDVEGVISDPTAWFGNVYATAISAHTPNDDFRLLEHEFIMFTVDAVPTIDRELPFLSHLRSG